MCNLRRTSRRTKCLDEMRKSVHYGDCETPRPVSGPLVVLLVSLSYGADKILVG